MNEYKLREATTEWLDKQNFDLFITLNTEVELTKEQMSELMCRLFYKTECDVFGKNINGEWRRELYKYKDKFHIKRAVVIEGDEKRTHAHIQVKTLEGFTNEQMIELLKLEYMKLLKTKREKGFLFHATQIANRDAVSRYTLKKNKIDLRSSFISKHSNKQ